jgi:hypothetical protein
MRDAETALAVIEPESNQIQLLKDGMEYEAARIAEMKKFVQAHMKEGQDFGVIPGTKAPTLYKPGAEVMCGIYKLEPEYEVSETYEPERVKESVNKWNKKVSTSGRYEVFIKCVLRHMGTGNKVGEGVGSCNNWEKKYLTLDIDDSKNTILKMAKKRAYVDATLSACRLSAFFTQDAEDMAPPPDDDGPVIQRQAAKAANAKDAADFVEGMSKDAEAHLGKDPSSLPEGVYEYFGIPTEVTHKDTAKGGKAFRVHFNDPDSDGVEWFGTFDTEVAATCEASVGKARLRLLYEKTKFGKKIMEIFPA